MISNSKLLIIANEVVELGEQKLIKIPVGQLPSGTKIYTHVFVNKSIAPGPTILLIGGMHGDEINGTEIVRRAAEVYKMNALHAGTLITIPLLNVYGFIRFTRDVAEGKDVNRSFPGNAKGSLAARIANILYNEILPHATILIDFHTGGEQRYNYPQVRFSKNDQESLDLAKIFSSPFMVESNWRPHSLRQYAGKFKIPNLAFEGGESSRFDGYSIDKALTGIENVLVANQMIGPLPKKAVQESIHIKSDIWIRASSSGIFVWSRSSGVFINKGEILATIADPDNIKVHYVFSRLSGYIIGHNNASVVHVGDALFHIGMT
ncbi:MAG: succinylglutamate desuccinylase/aspartoacylase family protein [Saprospiraceae bacterium]